MNHRFALLLTFVSLAATAKGAPRPAGQISLVTGTVLIFSADARVAADGSGKRGRKIAPGAPFYLGESIVTKSDGRVKLVFFEGSDTDGGNEVVLGPSTALTIKRASVRSRPERVGTRLQLERGEVRATVRRKYSGVEDDVFEVRSPNAVAGVRGTVFYMEFENGRTTVATLQGKVWMDSTLSRGASRIVVDRDEFSRAVGSEPPRASRRLADDPELQRKVSEVAQLGKSSPSLRLNRLPASEDGGLVPYRPNADLSDLGPGKLEAPLERSPTAAAKGPKSDRAPAEALDGNRGPRPARLLGEDAPANFPPSAAGAAGLTPPTLDGGFKNVDRARDAARIRNNGKAAERGRVNIKLGK